MIQGWLRKGLWVPYPPLGSCWVSPVEPWKVCWKRARARVLYLGGTFWSRFLPGVNAAGAALWLPTVRNSAGHPGDWLLSYSVTHTCLQRLGQGNLGRKQREAQQGTFFFVLSRDSKSTCTLDKSLPLCEPVLRGGLFC